MEIPERNHVDQDKDLTSITILEDHNIGGKRFQSFKYERVEKRQ